MQSKEYRKRQKFERALVTCKHFNGIWAPGMKEHSCRAGVDYRSLVGGETQGWVNRLPCLPKSADRTDAERAEIVPCALREFPTLGEVEAKEKADEEAFKITTSAIKLCRDHAAGKRGIGGDVECPKCKGRLNYTVAASNGHLWGKCETDGCLAWMM